MPCTCTEQIQNNQGILDSIMNVGIVTYNQLMQICQGDRRFPKRWGDYSLDGYPQNAEVGSYYGAQAEGSQKINEKDDRFISSSSFKEDSDEIDALLSLEDFQDEEDDDAVSTGRTPGDYSCNSPDTACSSAARNYGKQMRPCDPASGPGGETKRARVKKMVKVLRGIVPGGRQMDTPAFLDEAVKYLKSLKMEVSKLKVQNSEK